MRKFLLMLGVLGLFQVAEVRAEMEITIYNENMALMKKSMLKNLAKGVNEIMFDEVAKLMRPYSVYIYGDGISVLEQNYDYQKINYANMLENYIGKVVNTVRVNPATGENVFEKATLISVDNGRPVLQFSYGIDGAFNGRVVFEELPKGLNDSPVLKAKIVAQNDGETPLSLAYLTSGLSWQANYIANISDDKTLVLLGRVALDNNSGSDYDDVKIKLLAGNVNVIHDRVMPKMLRAQTMSVMASNEAIMMDTAVGVPESLNGYYIYELPEKTNLKDGQVKLVSFLNSQKVFYEKTNVFNSMLSIWRNGNGIFKNKHPQIVYKFYNTEENGLGQPLPQGKISFYDKDKSSSLQFIGENMIGNVAKGEELNLRVGDNFDIYANEEIQVQKISQEQNVGLYRYSIKFVINNESESDNHIILKQHVPGDIVISPTPKNNEGIDLLLEDRLLKETRIISASPEGKLENGEYIFEFDMKASEKEKIVELVLERYERI